ncbi:MAG: D-alanyl-D-alanine carboxypeptidase [Methylophilaceae bacterium]|nr:D-alanyl-D-alanine carboxypeptidase [Methylophilaceae bacterium]
MSHLFKKIAVSILSIHFAFISQIVTAADIPPPPPLAVKAYVLKDFNGNMIIAEQNGSGRVEPASLTKLMTAYVVFGALKNGHLQLSQTLPVSEKAWKVEGSKMFIEPNKPVIVDDLLHGMIIQSGNDASIALAEGVASTEELFASMMNKEAARLGMKNTHYMNATGLPDANHYTTAHDLSLLASALIHDFPSEYKRLYGIKQYTYNNITQPNRNRLLWADATVDGMKTGHTESAGFCLISSANRDGRRFISVVLGAANDSARATESQKLLNFGFQFYEATLVYKKAQNISAIKVWKGKSSRLNTTVANDVYVTLPKGEYAKVKATIASQKSVIAPISKGQVVGKINFTLDDKIIESRDLIATQDIAAAGFFGKIVDSIKMLF